MKIKIKDLYENHFLICKSNGYKILQEIKDSGIITISSKTLNHSVKGEFTGLGNPKKPPILKNGGLPKGGGHSQAGINELKARGWSVEITKTYKNGVRIGNIPKSKEKFKQRGSQMSWFSKDWTDDDILVAGTYVANNPKSVEKVIKDNNLTEERLFAKYNKLTICVSRDTKGNITSIFPTNKQYGGI